MEDIQISRKKINEIDKEIACLFEKRMEAVKNIAEYKRSMNLPIFDSGREREVIEKNSMNVENPDVRGYYIRLLQSMMVLSKQYQHKLCEGVRVAYSGVRGAFANIAARRIFPDGTFVSYGDFSSAYKAVENGECDCAVLPIENSFAGEVGQVTDLLFKGSLHVNGIYTLKITHNLLGLPDSDISDIKKVISHPQALSQCAAYIKKHGFESVEALNTAVAAKNVSENGDVRTAAIASAETAELYGLKVLDHDINESSQNYTKFAVFSLAKRPVEDIKTAGSTFLILFTVKHTAGSLAQAVNVIGKYGFNMKALRSRPMRELPWQYYFYVEAEGDETSESGKAMLKELSEHCEMLKTVGHYTTEISLENGDKK